MIMELTFKPSARLRVVLALCTSAVALHATELPPGVPEPGLVLWGSVVNQTNASQAITITDASWSVTDGVKTAVYSTDSRPAVRIVNMEGKSYYILHVPFDTRQIGNVTLGDPAGSGIDSFELKAASPPTYTMVATINGALASVRSIDGAPASGDNVPVSGFGAAARGRVIRVDLAITPVGDGYEAWAAAIFGSPDLAEAARTADPDGDGLNNEGEFAAGTDPKDPDSNLRILELSVQNQPLPTMLGWRSAANRSYIIEHASSPMGPWTPLGSPVTGTGTTTQAPIQFPTQESQGFYRVRLAP